MATNVGTLSVNVAAKTRDLTVGLARATTSVRDFSTKTQGYMIANANAIRQLRRAFLVVGAATVAGIGLAIKSYTSFQKQMTFVSTMLDDMTMKFMPAFTRGIKNMAAEFGEGTDTLSRGLYDILSASIGAEQAMDVLAVSVKAAKAGMTDTAVAADAITTVLNSYSMSADRAGEVSDKLFAIVKRGKTTFEALAPNIGKVSATAAIAGLSFEELGASIATLTRAGIRTEEAMTAINGILRSVMKPGADATAMAKTFGFELNTTTLESKGLVWMLKQLKGATAEQLAVIAPNIRGMKGFAAGLAQVEGQANDLKLMLNSTGLTQEAYNKTTATTIHQFNQLKQATIILAGTVGRTLNPEVMSMIDVLKDFITTMNAVEEETGSIGIAIANAMRRGMRFTLGLGLAGNEAAIGFKKLALAINEAAILIKEFESVVSLPGLKKEKLIEDLEEMRKRRKEYIKEWREMREKGFALYGAWLQAGGGGIIETPKIGRRGGATTGSTNVMHFSIKVEGGKEEVERAFVRELDKLPI